ncbi:hypothetical protein ACEWPM_015605 [Roseovarius sp. S4756]
MTRLASDRIAVEVCAIAFYAGKAQSGLCLAGRHRQVKARAGGVRRAPDCFDGHPVIGGVHQVENPGFAIVPQGQRQLTLGHDAAQIIGIPMRKGRAAFNRNTGFIHDGNLNLIGAIGAMNYA